MRSSVPCGGTARPEAALATIIDAFVRLDRREGEALNPGQPLVLLVDDDAAIVDAMEMLLEASGFSTQPAATAMAALAFLRLGGAPDVLVTDFRMPDMEGPELIRQARGILGRLLPAVLLTGEVTLKGGDLPGLAGCRILHKPMKPDHLVALLQQLTDPSRGA